MAKQTINPGIAPTGIGGDTFRSGGAKLQANDDELYAQLGANPQGVLPAALPVSKGGTGATTAEAARTSLGLGTAATATVTTSDIDLTKGRLLKVGDFGFGAPKGNFSGINLNSTEFKCNSIIFSTGGTILNAWANGIFMTFAGNVNRFAQIGFLDYGNGLRVRTGNNIETGGGWATVKTTSNTTADSNGFLKNASPIVQLFSNEIKLNDEAKEQPITFEKLGIGDYLVKGSLGFAQEGWYIEQPKDANGNVLVAVVYKQLENNDISVKTYQKKFNLETASIVADLDKPADIPDGRWIDLRLQELPQPEIEEEPISNTPPDFQPTGIAAAVQEMMYGAE